MLTLLSEARFWSFRDDVVIKDTNLNAFRYQEKKDALDTFYYEGKKMYAESRGLIWAPNNKRPAKLRDSIRELDEQLNQHSIIFCQWRDHCVLQLILSSGLLVHICVNVFTGDILKVAFDKYLVGKLLSDYICTVIYTSTHILCSYNDNQVTLIHLAKQSLHLNAPDKLSNLDPRLVHKEIAGPSGRKLDRYMVINISGDMLLIWWKSSQDEVYPWAPQVKEQDRANIHVYSLSGTKLELMCYHRTEQDPVSVGFSQIHEHIIRTIEQKVTKKGEVTVENCTYSVSKSRLQRTAVTSIPLQTQVCCHSYSPDDEKLILGCIDGSVVLFDEGRGITHLVKADFIPTLIAWHLDGAIAVIANEKSQFQFFDISLASIMVQLISDDTSSSNLLDLTSYFSYPPTLLKMCWSKKSDLSTYTEEYAQTDCFLLLLYEHGPLAVVRLFGGNGITDDVHNLGLTADVLVHQYLSSCSIERAINILLCLNWDSYGSVCLNSLHKIVNHLLQQPLNDEVEVQLQSALASFHAPLRPISYETELEYGEQVIDMTRRFFHHLLRFQSYEKAFCLAIDINHYDLFMDLYHCAMDMDDNEMAQAAKAKAEEVYEKTESFSSDHSTCSNSSCSQCCSEESMESDDESCSSEDCQGHNDDLGNISPSQRINSENTTAPPLPLKKNTLSSNMTTSYTPPLPFTKHHETTREYCPAPPLPDLNSSSILKSRHLQPDHNIKNSLPFALPQTNFGSRYNDHTMKFSNSLVSTRFSSSNLDLPKAPKPPMALPRSIPKHHIVDIIPKPILNRTQSANTLYGPEHSPMATNVPSIHSTTYMSPNYTRITTKTPESSVNLTAPIFQYPLISGQIPRQSVLLNYASKFGSTAIQSNVPKIPPPPSIMNAMTLLNINHDGSQAKYSSVSNNVNGNIVKHTGERNKVKFSDTVTVAVVPEIPRRDKPNLLNDIARRPKNFYQTDPKRELADSLPLCHPNEDYLKDFTPMLDNKKAEEENHSKIKVVHFGVV